MKITLQGLLASTTAFVRAGSAAALASEKEFGAELLVDLNAGHTGTSNVFIYSFNAPAPDTSLDQTATTTFTVTTNIATFTADNISMATSVSSTWSYSSSLPDPTTPNYSMTVSDAASASGMATILSNGEPVSSIDISTHPPPSITTTNSLLLIANTSTTTISSLSSSASYTGTVASMSVVGSIASSSSGTVSIGGTATESAPGNVTISKSLPTLTSVTYITIDASSTTATIPTGTSSAQSAGEDVRKDGLKTKTRLCLLVAVAINVVFAAFM